MRVCALNVIRRVSGAKVDPCATVPRLYWPKTGSVAGTAWCNILFWATACAERGVDRNLQHRLSVLIGTDYTPHNVSDLCGSEKVWRFGLVAILDERHNVKDGSE